MMYWVEGVDVAFSERREDDRHERSLGFACAAPRLDAFKHRVGRHAFRTSGLMCAKSYGSEFGGDNNSQNDLRLYAVFSFIFRSLSVAIRKTFVFFTGTKREGLASKTCQKTRLTINVRKSGGAASF
jgi:hypothetical protein